MTIRASLTRRGLLASLPASAFLLTSCRPEPTAEQLVQMLISAPDAYRAPAAGIVVMQNNLVIAQAAAGEADVGVRPFTTRSALRAASISKLVVALTAEKLHRDGVLDLDQGVRSWLPYFPSDTAAGPDGPSLRALLSHTSGMKDPEAYWLAHPGNIETLLTRDAFRESKDFEYCNLGYGIVATAIEIATQRRFDRVARDIVLKPMGLDAGFNWSGVSPEKRRDGATLYRNFGNGWASQIDDRNMLRDTAPSVLLNEGTELSTYQPGTNGTLFSPQGGLRANLIDLATIAARLKYAPELTRPVWSLNQAQTNGVHDQRYFTHFGTGVQIHPAEESPWPGIELWGHPGEAYGLFSGAWFAPELNISFAYAVTGTPDGTPERSARHPALNVFTEVLMDAVMTAYAASPASK
jgi:CubicO group peptidase (beta-lactamase class C family)